jgi:hypothetical protein
MLLDAVEIRWADGRKGRRHVARRLRLCRLGSTPLPCRPALCFPCQRLTAVSRDNDADGDGAGVRGRRRVTPAVRSLLTRTPSAVGRCVAGVREVGVSVRAWGDSGVAGCRVAQNGYQE